MVIMYIYIYLIDSEIYSCCEKTDRQTDRHMKSERLVRCLMITLSFIFTGIGKHTYKDKNTHTNSVCGRVCVFVCCVSVERLVLVAVAQISMTRKGIERIHHDSHCCQYTERKPTFSVHANNTRDAQSVLCLSSLPV